MNIKDKYQKKIKQINVSMTENQFATLEEIRKGKGKNISELIREFLMFQYQGIINLKK